MFEFNLEEILFTLVIHQTITHMFISHKHQLTQLDHVLSHTRISQQ